LTGAAADGEQLRIAIIYDCLYPHTIGGAERWYRNLAARLAQRHDVTYLTRTQWSRNQKLDAPARVNVIAFGRWSPLYTRSGRRRIGPPLWFGWRVLIHLLRNRRRYDVVHTCSFPFFPMLFASAAVWAGGPPLVTDWIEVWPTEYWISYLGGFGGRIGAAIQKLCIKATRQAFALSESTAVALRRYGYDREPVVLHGLFERECSNEGSQPCQPERRAPLVVYVGRHIREKRVTAIPGAIAAARRTLPALRAVIFGDGPERERLLAEINRLNLAGSIECPGFVDWRRIERALSEAMCLLLPSEREGYGLVVLEAAAHGTPSIVVDGPNNAAKRLVEHGINGYVAASADAVPLAAAILRVSDNSVALVSRTRAWFKQHEASFRIENSLPRIEDGYRATTGRSRNCKPSQPKRWESGK
jgi:glycosyltransferase involved in cell wall biosynthesis